MDILMVKTLIVLGVIAGCFIVLYPKIFHPMVNNVLGSSHANDQNDDMFRVKSPGNVKNGPGRDFPRQQRSGPHPAMRTNADAIRKTMQAQQQQATPGGGGRGMIGMVLPMYAIGIVIYLLYTLSKVFGGKKKTDDDYLAGHFKAKSEQKGDAATAKEKPTEARSAKSERKAKKQKSRDLEDLLIKANDETLNGSDMDNLKKRLQDTERQMSMILQAMQGVQSKIETGANSDNSSSEGSASEQFNQQMEDIQSILIEQNHQKDQLQKLSDRFETNKKENLESMKIKEEHDQILKVKKENVEEKDEKSEEIEKDEKSAEIEKDEIVTEETVPANILSNVGSIESPQDPEDRPQDSEDRSEDSGEGSEDSTDRSGDESDEYTSNSGSDAIGDSESEASGNMGSDTAEYAPIPEYNLLRKRIPVHIE